MLIRKLKVNWDFFGMTKLCRLNYSWEASEEPGIKRAGYADFAHALRIRRGGLNQFAHTLRVRKDNGWRANNFALRVRREPAAFQLNRHALRIKKTPANFPPTIERDNEGEEVNDELIVPGVGDASANVLAAKRASEEGKKKILKIPLNFLGHNSGFKSMVSYSF